MPKKLVNSFSHCAIQELAGSQADWQDARDRVAGLTRRQREVLKLLSEGLVTKEIARELNVSPRTVDIHRGALMMKLGAANSADAVRIAIHAALAEQFAG